jgi:hypothetical protein
LVHSLRHVGGFMDRLSVHLYAVKIRMCKLLQPAAYVVGMDEFLLGCIYRYLYGYAQ